MSLIFKEKPAKPAFWGKRVNDLVVETVMFMKLLPCSQKNASARSQLSFFLNGFSYKHIIYKLYKLLILFCFVAFVPQVTHHWPFWIFVDFPEKKFGFFGGVAGFGIQKSRNDFLNASFSHNS